jgi:hypothetical protein
MIKLKNIIGLPSLQYHVDNSLSLHENVYRYSSESFIQLFAEARDAWRDGMIELEVEDANLIETTDIGLYGEYNGQKVPLDLPMIYEAEYKGRQLSHEEEARLDLIAHRQYDEDFKDCTDEEKDNVWNQRAKVGVKEAKYKGKDVPLNKPKRGGSKKFFVYTKNKKGNVVKVSFGGTTGLSVKIKEKGARASFAARHKCATKKDKTKPGYWACNVGRYWKSLGGAKNFSGYW